MHISVKCLSHRTGVLSEGEVFDLYDTSRYLWLHSVDSAFNALISSSTFSIKPIPIIGVSLLEINPAVEKLAMETFFFSARR